MMTVSLCIIAYNEEKFLPTLLADISAQTYPHAFIEVILVDGNSSDNTKSIMLDFQNSNQTFKQVKVLDNPKRIQAAGWNVAISNAVEDVIIRIDAHTHIPAEFTEKNIALHEEGEFVTGGVRPCVIEEPNAWKNTLLEVENSLFGSSISDSRHSSEKKYVKSMFHSAYRKEVFEKAGIFNENLLRTEDNEMHYRIRSAGYKFCFDPNIVSYQYARSSLKKMIKQKYGNGYWIGLTLGICPGCISVYHFVPFVFILGILLTTILAFFGWWLLAAIMWCAYGFFTLVSTLITFIKHRGNRYTILMPALFLILHISYGIGTLIGLLKMPFWRRKQK